MGPPAVYLEREPLLAMLYAAVEVYNRECLGILFGSPPSRKRNTYRVRSAVVLQAVVKRTNSGVTASTRADRRITGFLKRVGSLYPPIIGDFHSHPHHHLTKRKKGLSGFDAQCMATPSGRLCPLAVVIRIVRHKKRIALWRRLDRKTRLRGTLNAFTFDVTAFRIVGEGSEWKPEALVIEIAPSTRKALNRARRS